MLNTFLRTFLQGKISTGSESVLSSFFWIFKAYFTLQIFISTGTSIASL